MRTLIFTSTISLMTFLSCGEMAPVLKCNIPSGSGTTHNFEKIETKVTWSAATSPHVVTFTPEITSTGTLVIEPCAVVKIQAGQGLFVAGRLEALGTANQPIVITAEDVTKPFGFIEVRGGFVDMSSVTLTAGGAVGANSNAMLDIWGAMPERTVNGRLRDVTILDSVQYGLTLERKGTLSEDSNNLTIKGCKSGPIMARGAELAQGIPAGTYTGNSVDEILVIARDALVENTIWRDRKVPYRLGDNAKNGFELLVGAASKPASLTLEAGVKIKVTAAGGVYARKDGTNMMGTILAQGTATAPVVFTSASATPLAGDWRGIVFETVPTAATKLDGVEIRYAGGPSQANSFHCLAGSPNGSFSTDENAALTIFGQPGSAFLTNSLIADSAADGVDLAYNGSSVDFTPSNTFTNVARCRVSTPRKTDASCPVPVPACP